ncbi:MAG: hypothetical protein QOE45_270 [Frankiaceae bacterium]|jgi:hypothetical protein|nr:hypothetical protein [Frankiaceae bacterium]
MNAEDALREALVGNQVIAVAGCGVALAASRSDRVASWRGLIESGRDLVLAECRPGDAWRDLVQSLLSSGEPGDLVIAATKITAALGRQRYVWWLGDTVGRLELVDTQVPAALIDLGAPVATTNYDRLIEKSRGLPSATWQDPEEMQRIFRGLSDGVVHLHGIWTQPESVVFGNKSYEDVLRDQPTQALQQAVAVTKSLLFVGVGQGGDDPNIGGLLAWLANAARWSSNRHFWLCLESEVDRIDKKLFSPVPYGRSHSDLAGFLRTLAPSTPVTTTTRSLAPPAATAAPPWTTVDVEGPWTAFTADGHFRTLAAATEVVCRLGDRAVRQPLAHWCEMPLRDLALAADGSYLVALDERHLLVWTVNLDGSLTPWRSPFPLATDGVRLLGVRGVTSRAPAIDVALLGGGLQNVRLESTGRMSPVFGGSAADLKGAPIVADSAIGASVMLRASVVEGADGRSLVVRREDLVGSSERSLPIGSRSVDRVVVARSLRGRAAPYAVVIEADGGLAVWRWQDLPAEQREDRELVDER